MEINGWGYVAAFALSLFLSWGLTPLTLRLALAKQILDHPEGYKKQVSAVPYLGGLAIVVSFVVTMAAAAIIASSYPATGELLVILFVGLVLGLLGLLDDIWGLHPLLRLFVEVIAAIALWEIGISIGMFADNDLLNEVITVIWIVGITNAFNLLDNMDGLSAGVAAIASTSFFVIAAINGQFLVAGLSAALAGCALGFLRHNFHPAKIYMGDAGSLFLGMMLAVIGVKLRFVGDVQVTFLVPILVLGVPIFDTALVTITRRLHGENVFLGGRDHTSHRLVFVGIPVRVAVALIYGASISLGWLALVLSRIDRSSGFLLMGLIMALALFAGALLGLVPVYEKSNRRRVMLQEVVPHEHEEVADPSKKALAT